MPSDGSTGGERARGEPLCLAFANTTAERPGKEVGSILTDYNSFVRWMERAGAIGAGDAQRLGERADEEAEETVVVLRRAAELREAIHSLFEARAGGRAVEPVNLDLLDREWREARTRLRLVRRGYRFSARFPPGGTTLARPLWSIASSAAELLLSDSLDRVRVCDAPGCTHLFLDTTRNRSRRWCDMSICGNRMKARRHYQRHKGSG